MNRAIISEIERQMNSIKAEMESLEFLKKGEIIGVECYTTNRIKLMEMSYNLRLKYLELKNSEGND